MEIKPIKTDRDYRRALKTIERLMDAKPNTPGGDALDISGHPRRAIGKKSITRSKRRTPSKRSGFSWSSGLTRKDLEPLIGSRARVAEVLNRKRPLTLPMNRKLHASLGIPADVLIG